MNGNRCVIIASGSTDLAASSSHDFRELRWVAGSADERDLLAHQPSAIESHRIALHGNHDNPTALHAETRDL